MAATEPIDIVELGVGDAPAGLILSTEAGWNQNEADWRFFLSPGNRVRPARRRPVGRNRGTAALLGRQCLDQHGAGDRQTCAAAALPPGSSMPVSLQRHGAVLRPGWTRRRPAPPSTDRSASPRRCNCGGCGCRERRGHQGSTTAIGQQPRAVDRVRRRRHGIRPQLIAVRVRRSSGFSHRIRCRRDRPGSGRPHRAAYRSRCSPIAPIRHWPWSTPSSRSESGPWLIDAVHSQDEFLNGLVQSGWNIERPFQRMRFGPATASPAQLPFAVAGPEFG